MIAILWFAIYLRYSQSKCARQTLQMKCKYDSENTYTHGQMMLAIERNAIYCILLKHYKQEDKANFPSLFKGVV